MKTTKIRQSAKGEQFGTPVGQKRRPETFDGDRPAPPQPKPGAIPAGGNALWTRTNVTASSKS